MSVTKEEPGHEILSAMPLRRNRDFLLLWSGQAISACGSQISEFAMPLYALVLTGSPVLMGVVASMRFISYLILSLPAGAFVDRWDRKRLMIFCDAGRAICLGSIPIAQFLFQPPLPFIVAQLSIATLLEGCFFVFFNIAEAASLPQVVAKEQLDTAVSMNETAFNIANTLGPFLGGVLFGIGRTLPFLVDAISYAVSVLTLGLIQTKFQGERESVSVRHLGREIKEGLGWLWQHHLIRSLACFSAIANMIMYGVAALIFVSATEQHASPFAIGVIFTAAGIGGILGALAATPLQKRLSFRVLFPANEVMLFLVCLLFLVATHNIVLLGVVVGCFFFLESISVVVTITYRLAQIPDVLQGRVNSVFRLIAFLGGPLGLLLTGALLEYTAVVPTILVLLAIEGGLVVFVVLNPSIRNAPPLHNEESA